MAGTLGRMTRMKIETTRPSGVSTTAKRPIDPNNPGQHPEVERLDSVPVAAWRKGPHEHHHADDREQQAEAEGEISRPHLGRFRGGSL